jgi:predicted nucleic acid-binding protein
VSVFLDTNILVYAQTSGAKADKARELLGAGGKLSVQVLNEFAAVTRRKLQKDWNEIGEAIDDALALVDPPLPITFDTHATAMSLARDHGFSFYDALIVASALEAGCDTLFTEDMQHGRRVESVVIVNLFAPL